jgi:hypothetical protein
MKSKYIKLKIAALIVFSALLYAGCKKTEVLPEAPRLFRPVASTTLDGAGNWIAAYWTSVKGATGYTAEISRDSFKTIIKSVSVDTTEVVFDNLEWLTLYQVQVKAIASPVEKSSGFSFLGERKTEKFPSIMNTPSSSEILDKAVLLSWTNKTPAVTNFKITLQSSGSLVQDVTLNATDIANQYKVVSGLTPSTTYVATLYSTSTVRGYETITTVPQIITGTSIIDLTQQTNPDILTTAYLASLPAGSTIILKRGMTYNISGTVAIDRALTFVSEVTFFAPPAKMYMISNLNITASSTIPEIAFKTVDLIGSSVDGYASRYVFNINVACTVTKVTFDDCKIKAVRGVLRTQAGPQINTVSFNKCLIDSISNYGVVNCDNTGSSIQNVVMTNSTVSDAQKLFVSKSNTNSVLVDNCTFYFVPLSPNYFFDYGSLTVAGGVTIKNSIFAGAKPTTAVPPVSTVGGFRPATVNITSAGNFKTSDLVWVLGTDLPGLADYSGTSANLFRNPANDDFFLIDSKFAGKATAGDPRWRP